MHINTMVEDELDESANFVSSSPSQKMIGRMLNNDCGEGDRTGDFFITTNKKAREEFVVIENSNLQNKNRPVQIETRNENLMKKIDTSSYQSGETVDKAEIVDLSNLQHRGQQQEQQQQQMYETAEKNIFELSSRRVPLPPNDNKALEITLPQQKAESQRESFCTLFVIFGLNASKFVNENFKEEYEVLGSYPDLQQHPEVASEHKFVQDLRMICLPEVHLKPERFHLSRMDPLCRYQYFHFITTNDMGNRQYLTSIHFKEILLSEKGAFVIDKAICVTSSQPIFSLQKQVLYQIFHRVVLKNNNVSIRAFKEAQRTHEGCLDEYEQPITQDFPNFVYKFMTDQIMCSENRRVRDMSSPSRKASPNQRTKTLAKGLPVVDFTPIMELYITIFCRHFYFDAKVQRDICIQFTENSLADVAKTPTSEQQYVTNASTSGSGTNYVSVASDIGPTPTADSNKKNATKDIPLFKFRNMKPFGFQLENFQFDILLQMLKPEKLIHLMTALLLERKIVLIKDEIGDIALIMQGLLTLMSPFQWCFTVITYLHRELVDILDAPFPFLIGVSTAVWEDICTLKDYPEDIYIFDLESQERRFLSKVEIPELPQPFGDELLAGLKDVMDKKDRRLEALRAEMKQSRHRSVSKIKFDQEEFDSQYWADAELSVKQLFFNFLLQSIDNYLHYCNKDDEKDDENGKGEVAAHMIGAPASSDDFFDFQGYLDWQEERAATNGTSNAFIRELVATQAFQRFIEQNQGGPDCETDSAAVFFESCIDLMNKKMIPFKKVKAAQQDMIDTAKNNLGQPIKFKFSGIYAKYMNGLRKREITIRKQLEEIDAAQDNEEHKGRRSFTQMSQADQIDEVIMKYIFNKPEKPKDFRQFSLIQDVNLEMVLEEFPPIAYDQVENYWKRVYKERHTTRTQSARPIDEQQPQESQESARQETNPHNHNEPQNMHVQNPALTKRKQRTKYSQQVYDDYIKGSENYESSQQQLIKLKPIASQKTHAPSGPTIIKKSGGAGNNNIIHDLPSVATNESIYEQLKTMKESINQGQPARLSINPTTSQSTLQKLSSQKSTTQHRTAYKVRTVKSKVLQVNTSIKKQSTLESNNLTQGGFRSARGSMHQIRLTKSPKVVLKQQSFFGGKKSACSISRGPGLNSMYGGGTSSRNNILPISQSLASLSQVKSTRQKSYSTTTQKQEFRPQLPAEAISKREGKVTKTMIGRQRGSLQFVPEKAKVVLETPSAIMSMDTPNSHSFIQLHFSQTDQSEINLQGGSNMEHRMRSYNEEEEEGLTLRQKNLPQLKAAVTQRVPAQQFSSNTLAKSERSLLSLSKPQNKVHVQAQLRRQGLLADDHPNNSIKQLRKRSGYLAKSNRVASATQHAQNFATEFRRARKAAPEQDDPSILEALARNSEIEIPEYTEKKAHAQPGLTQKPLKGQIAVASYEVSDSGDNDFINIVKKDQEEEEEEKDMDQQWKKVLDEPHLDLKVVPDMSPTSQDTIPEDTNAFNFTENFRDGVNEMVGDEADVAQKTAYTSKFKQLNSEEIRSTVQPREQMMPTPSSTSLYHKVQSSQSNNSNMWSQSTTSLRPSDPGTYRRRLIQQQSHHAGFAQRDSLLSDNSKPGMMNSTEKQNMRKAPAMSLGMLLSRTESTRMKKRTGNNSKTRSITDKQQLSYQALTGLNRLPSKSHVILKAATPVSSELPETGTPSTITQERAAQDMMVRGDETDGWFTAVESMRLSQKMSMPIMPSMEKTAKQFSEDFYEDGNKVDSQRSIDQTASMAITSREEIKQYQKATVVRHPEAASHQTYQPHRLGLGSHSPQDQELLQAPASGVSDWNEPRQKQMPLDSVEDAGDSTSLDIQTQRMNDNRITAPNDGILFTGNKKQRYQAYFS